MITLLVAAWCFVIPCPGSASARPARVPTEQAIRDAEDARAPDAAALATIVAGLAGPPSVQRVAVRALGRLERESLVDRIAPLLRSEAALVRADAVNALGQAVVRGRAAMAYGPLAAQALVERDPLVRGVIARTLGRLPYDTSDEVRRAEALMMSLAASSSDHVGSSGFAFGAGGPSPPSRTPSARRPDPEDLAPAEANIAHGLEAIARRRSKLASLGESSRAWLRRQVVSGTSEATVVRTALRALIAVGDVDEALVSSAGASPDAQVRRLAIAAAGVAQSQPWIVVALERGLADRSFLVRVEALTQVARVRRDAGCTALLGALDDANAHVQLRAIDLVGTTCGADPAATDVVARIAVFSAGRPDAGSWHRPGHALVALAKLAPARVTDVLTQAVESDVWQVRMYAARAVGAADSAATLVSLTTDSSDNVRNAAIEAMSEGHREGTAASLLMALGRPDPQLLRTTALALKGTPLGAQAVPLLASALTRVTRERKDTTRDVRIALIDRLAELGRSETAASNALRAHLADFDPAVARRAAEVLSAWTGRQVEAHPVPHLRPPIPTAAARAQAARVGVVVTMKRGGRFRVRLFPEEAPTNTDRFVRLARAGWFSGLTFHRVEPGFVVQGGSPGANEYAGDGAYTRDEVGLRSHTRGTIGVSTRGRDTGDKQIFINLVDNIRLDHDYTVFGEVTGGMEVVDGILEGDTIARIEIRG